MSNFVYATSMGKAFPPGCSAADSTPSQESVPWYRTPGISGAHLLLWINGCCILQKQMALQLIGGKMMLFPERKHQVFVAGNLEKMEKN